MVAENKLHGKLPAKNPFIVKELIPEWEMDKDHITAIKELKDNFTSRKEAKKKDKDNPNKPIPASTEMTSIAAMEDADGMNTQDPIDADAAAPVQQMIKIGDVEVDVSLITRALLIVKLIVNGRSRKNSS